MEKENMKQNSSKRSTPRGRGDSRLFASALGGLKSDEASPLPGSSRSLRTPKYEEPIEKLENIDAIISHIVDLTNGSDRSAAQIKRNIAANHRLFSQMNENDWQKLVSAILETGLNNGEGEFVCGLFVPLLEYNGFCDEIDKQLQEICSKYILIGEPANDSVPVFLGTILCAHWPRHMSHAVSTVNIVLFLAKSIVKGWLQVLMEDGMLNDSSKKEKPPPVLCDDSDDHLTDDDERGSEKEKSEAEETDPPEEPEVVNRCASAISALCYSTQRSLWMKCPELVDEIFATIKPTICNNPRITGDVKEGLLRTLISFHLWTKTKAVTNKTTGTQTVNNPSQKNNS